MLAARTILCFCLLLLTILPGRSQQPQPTPTPPFRLNLRVVYSGEKEHPDLAAFIYKALRDLPGVGLVDRDPDAVLMVSEMGRGNQYACHLSVLVPANEEVQQAVDFANSMEEGDERSKQIAREVAGETDNRAVPAGVSWRKWLKEDVRKMQPMYHYGGGIIMLDASPKVALAAAIKSLGATYVEKEHREYDYSVAHPVVLAPFHPPPPIYDPTPTPAPAPKRTPTPWNPPTMATGQEFKLSPPCPTPGPVPLTGEDPKFPSSP